MEFIIITGLSGAGKSNAMRIMEDIGYYCVDNIPPVLIPTFYSLCEKSTDKHLKRLQLLLIFEAEMFLMHCLMHLTSSKAITIIIKSSILMQRTR